jgi:hypothetical protein
MDCCFLVVKITGAKFENRVHCCKLWFPHLYVGIHMYVCIYARADEGAGANPTIVSFNASV